MAQSAIGLDVSQIKEIEERIQQHLTRLEELETITKEDLEALRKDLPTDPMLADALEKALPYPWSDLFEFVEASEQQSAHWRPSHDRSAIRSEADRKHKERFAAAAREARGLTGTVKRNGKEIPASAAHLAETVSGDETQTDEIEKTGERALNRLKELVRE